MKIGLVIAIERELKAFLSLGTGLSSETVCGKTVYKAQLGGHEIYALRSGCGEIDAAAATMLLLCKYNCEMLLNFGVTGALKPGLHVEDLFLAEKVCHHDYDVSPIDPVKPHQYGEFPDEFIPLDQSLIASARQKLPGLKLATVASGDRFVVLPQDKEALAALGCDICDMELAAIARTAALCGVPCLSVKCISDTFEGDGGDFNTNVIRSAQRAFDLLLKLICPDS